MALSKTPEDQEARTLSPEEMDVEMVGVRAPLAPPPGLEPEAPLTPEELTIGSKRALEMPTPEEAQGRNGPAEDLEPVEDDGESITARKKRRIEGEEPMLPRFNSRSL